MVVVEMDKRQDEYPSCTNCRVRLGENETRVFEVKIGGSVAVCLCARCLRDMVMQAVDCMGRD
jgi:hypothetical protein